jgi:hypothetical protein
MADKKYPNRTKRRGPRDRALSSLLSGATVTQAALEAKVNRQTVSNWVNHDADFKKRYRESVERIRGFIELRIKTGAARAAETLLELLDSNEDRIKLAAAVRLLDFHRRLPQPETAKEPLNMTLRELVEDVQDKIENGLGGGL